MHPVCTFSLPELKTFCRFFLRNCQTKSCGSSYHWNWGQSFAWLEELWDHTVRSLLCQKKWRCLNAQDYYSSGYEALQSDTFCRYRLAVLVHLLLLVKLIRALKSLKPGAETKKKKKRQLDSYEWRKMPLERRMQGSGFSHALYFYRTATGPDTLWKIWSLLLSSDPKTCGQATKPQCKAWHHSRESCT